VLSWTEMCGPWYIWSMSCQLNVTSDKFVGVNSISVVYVDTPVNLPEGTIN